MTSGGVGGYGQRRGKGVRGWQGGRRRRRRREEEEDGELDGDGRLEDLSSGLSEAFSC